VLLVCVRHGQVHTTHSRWSFPVVQAGCDQPSQALSSPVSLGLTQRTSFERHLLWLRSDACHSTFDCSWGLSLLHFRLVFSNKLLPRAKAIPFCRRRRRAADDADVIIVESLQHDGLAAGCNDGGAADLTSTVRFKE
jgi:hypothetical protein